MTEYLCDAVVQTRMDRRTLATIALWMQKKSYRPATRSDLIRLALECFEQVIGDEVRPVQTTHEASRILLKLFPQGVNPSNRGRSALMKNLQTDILRRPLLKVADHGEVQVSEMEKRVILDSIEREQAKKDAEQLDSFKELGERPDGKEEERT